MIASQLGEKISTDHDVLEVETRQEEEVIGTCAVHKLKSNQ